MDETFGAVNRYYSQSDPSRLKEQRKLDYRLEEMIKRLLLGYHKDLQDKVLRTVKQWNLIVRDHVRKETALRLTVGDDRQAVPVRVEDGLPIPFAQLIGEVRNETLLRLLLNRNRLQDSIPGLEIVQQHYGSLKDIEQITPFLIDQTEILRTLDFMKNLIHELDKLELLKKIKEINTDVLGAYFFHLQEIQLYWMVIGIYATLMNVSVEALTLIILIHEVAHAYTHLGQDIDNEKWETNSFAGCHLFIVEGLAQFYTESIAKKLSPRFPDVETAFYVLLGNQSKAYTDYQTWIRNEQKAGEVVRFSMIGCRRKGIIDYDRFHEELKLVKQRVGA